MEVFKKIEEDKNNLMRTVVEKKLDMARESALKNPIIGMDNQAPAAQVVTIRFSSNYTILTGVSVVFAEFEPDYEFYPFWNVESVCVKNAGVREMVFIKTLRTFELNAIKRYNEAAIDGHGRIEKREWNNTPKGRGFYLPFTEEEIKLLSEEHQALIKKK